MKSILFTAGFVSIALAQPSFAPESISAQPAISEAVVKEEAPTQEVKCLAESEEYGVVVTDAKAFTQLAELESLQSEYILRPSSVSVCKDPKGRITELKSALNGLSLESDDQAELKLSTITVNQEAQTCVSLDKFAADEHVSSVSIQFISDAIVYLKLGTSTGRTLEQGTKSTKNKSATVNFTA